MTDTLIYVSATSTKINTRGDEWSHDQHVRLYPSSPGIASLQIRSKGRTTDYGKAIRQAYSDAPLNMDTAITLRDALTAWIDNEHDRRSG